MCNGDPNYDHFKCVESYFYKQRECQYPWNPYKDSKLPICEKFVDLKRHIRNQLREFGAYRQWYTNAERSSGTQNQCPLPCTITSYDLRYLIQREGSGKSLKISFSDFRVEQKAEYLSCDKTCIIGEVGGNLGFFLGGSILIFFDILMAQIDRIERFAHGKWPKTLGDN